MTSSIQSETVTMPKLTAEKEAESMRRTYHDVAMDLIRSGRRRGGMDVLMRLVEREAEILGVAGWSANGTGRLDDILNRNGGDTDDARC